VIGGVVLDTTALLDIVTGATIYGQAFVSTAAERGVVLLIPSTSLSQAWATVPSESLPLLELLLELPVVVVDDMDLTTARAAGLVLRTCLGSCRRASERGSADVITVGYGVFPA
jgi:hypothetical protein